MIECATVKTRLRSLFILLFTLSAFSLVAAEKSKKADVSSEFVLENSYVGDTTMKMGTAGIGKVDEINNHFRYVMSRQISQGSFLRLGLDAERFSFGLPNGAPLPNTLQSTAVVIGADIELADSWLMRAEISPGIYSDFKDISGDDVDVPMIVGASYLVNENLQWAFGISIDPRRDMPVLPGAGVRWKFADQWTLNFILPKPRLEYEASEKLTLYAGGDIKSGSYRVDQNFGTNHGRPNLNNASVDYTEVRGGVGMSWRICPTLRVEVEGGGMVYRQFDYHDAGFHLKNNGIAPYGQLALKANF